MWTVEPAPGASWFCFGRVARVAVGSRRRCMELGADVLSSSSSLGLVGSSREIDIAALRPVRLAWGAQLRAPVSAL